MKKHFLASGSSKKQLLDSIAKGCCKYDWILEGWVILDNHYHLMLNAPDKADTLGTMFKEIHKFTAMRLKYNLPDLKDEKKIFYNYWDSCITFEKSYFARLNYIYYNPVKHSYLKEKYLWDEVKVKDDF